MTTTARFFKSPAAFRAWLEKHHASADELIVGYWKKGTGEPSLTWPESVDQALCFGWIDGVRRSLDEQRYTIRFTPRRPGSNWSAVNVRRARELIEQGLMTPAGLAAFEARQENRSGLYSYEERPQELPEPYASTLKKNKAASAFFAAQTPSYRKVATWFVVSAKKEETRAKRLAELIEHSAHGRMIPQYLSSKGK